VLFRQPSFFELYRKYVVGGLFVFTAQLALIVVLIVERVWRRRAEREAQRTHEHLAHLTRVSAMGELAASLAHELNQPLTAILSNAQAARHLLATNDPPLPELKDILQDIVDDDNRAGAVINRMRELVNKHATEHALVDINDVVQVTTKLVASDSIVREVSIGLELAPDIPMVEGDRVQLQQVLLNLLLNSLDATSRSDRFPHKVVIRTDSSDRHLVHVAVRDNGPGLPAETEQRIFEPFFTTKGSGMGMGLSIARSIVESHGGRIWATSDVCGAEFHFVLPRAAADVTLKTKSLMF
jgi:two-component system sensor kinase FixL